jgi:RNA polymerase sigma-70 factor (ECF subfamily)
VKPNQVEDPDLLRLIAQSDKERSNDALSELYDRYSRLVYSLAIRIVGERSLAEEVVQDVFLRVWDKAYTYRVREAKVSTWLTSITRNRAIDILRRQSVRADYYLDGWDSKFLLNLQSSDHPETSAEINIRRERIISAIKMLPAEQLNALTLSYFMGLSHSQIAKKLNEPLGTVKTRIRLAMQKLKDILSEDKFSSG